MILEKTYDIDIPKQNIIVICLTEECNLSCKYCYMLKKNNFNKMDFYTATQIVDFVLKNKKIFNKDKVIFDFIGGEPFLAIDLLDKVTDYIKKEMNKQQHPWNKNYIIRILTNGINYSQREVQEYIKKNKDHLIVGFSIDGNKEKHNLQRVFKNGKGSYDAVIKNVPLWLSQFPNSYAKATFSHEDLPLLKDSIISLWNLGIKDISANIVFENVWSQNDPIIFEKQLCDIADYIIENAIYKEDRYNLKFFNPNLCKPLNTSLLEKPYCPAGIDEFAFDCNGFIFPCIRFLDFSLKNKKGFSIGNVFEGFVDEKLEMFSKFSRLQVDTEKCSGCSVENSCPTCLALNYDVSEEPIDQLKRTTFNCSMHKANVRAAKYFYDNLEKLKIDGELTI